MQEETDRDTKDMSAAEDNCRQSYIKPELVKREKLDQVTEGDDPSPIT